MRFRRIREGDVILGIAPLIDIVFLLLIFFMVTSHFDITSGVLVRLPSVTKEIHEKHHGWKVIIIDKDGNIFFEKEKLTFKELGERLRELKEESGNAGVILQADRYAKHGTVIRVMDIAKKAGIRSVFIAARFSHGQPW